MDETGMEGKCASTSRHFQGASRCDSTSARCKEKGGVTAHASLANFVQRKRRRAAESSAIEATTTTTTANLTEMEKQVVALKTKYADMLLLFECGYRMRLFGDDAESAARVLGIRVQRHRTFMEASVPVHRVLHHGRRLVAAGFKIGIVKQLGVVAATSRQPLERDVVQVYTRATIPDVDDGADSAGAHDGDVASAGTNKQEQDDETVDDGQDATTNHTVTAPRFILAVVEETVQNKRLFAKHVHAMDPGIRAMADFENVRIGLFGHDIHSGESVFNEFEDGGKRTRLLEWLSLVEPVEFVLPDGGLSPQTEQVVEDFSRQDDIDSRDLGTRLEPRRSLCRLERVVFKDALECTAEADSSIHKERLVLPGLVRICLSAMETYLRSLKFDVRLSPDTIRPPQDHLRLGNVENRLWLPSATQRDLALISEVYSRSFGQHDGSLFSVMNHTRTMFGARRLKDWLRFPHTSIREIEERQDCVELLSCVSGEGAIIYEALCDEILPAAAATEHLLQQLHLRRATPSSVVRLLTALCHVEKDICRLKDSMTASSTIVHKFLFQYPLNSVAIEAALQSIGVDGFHNSETEKAVSKIWATYPTERRQYEDIKEKLRNLEQDFHATLATYRRELNMAMLEYTSHRSGGFAKTSDHLIAVDRVDLNIIPDDWLVISSTKTIVRYYPPRVRALQLQQDILNETKAQVVATVWQKVLAGIDSAIYMKGIRSVDVLAQLDCLASLATVARLYPNYVRPRMSMTEELTIVGGRHPTFELLAPQGSSYIAGDVAFSSGTQHGGAMVISGPNMGGKSTMLRMVALLVVMAQMGSFVPATSMTLPAFDAIHSRMHRVGSAKTTGWSGAGNDELVELSVLTNAVTPKSLVVLDEVGYGLTSQQARSLAFHTVKYLVKQVRCRVLMATHMIDVVQRFFDEGFSQEEIQAKALVHQVASNPSSDTTMDSIAQVVYHYTARDGIAAESLALQAASASGLPESVLNRAAAGRWQTKYR